MNRCLPVLLVLSCTLALIALPVFAQSGLPQTFIADTLEYAFSYPADWYVDSETNRVTNGVTSIFVRGPDSLYASYQPPWDTPLDVIQKLDAETLAQGEITEIELGGRPFARFFAPAYGDPPRQVLLLATIMENGEPVYMGATPADRENPVPLPEADIEAALAMAATLHSVREPLPQTLNQTGAADWRDTIHELEQVGLIATGGGRLIMQENRTSFDGAQNRVYGMARDFSVTNVVVAGTMNMAEAAESGSCVLYARYNRDSPDDEDNVIQSGIGARLYADNRLCGRVWEAESGTNRSVCSPAGAVFTSPQRVLLILLEDRMHIYANGQLAVRDVPIVMRAGSFATALVSEDPNVACEVTDIWAFEAIPLVPGLCTVSTSNTVNQRSGPGTGYAVAGQLSPGQTGTAVGQHDGGDGFIWYQLDGGAWMREDVITLYGDCGSLPDVAP